MCANDVSGSNIRRQNTPTLIAAVRAVEELGLATEIEIGGPPFWKGFGI